MRVCGPRSGKREGGFGRWEPRLERRRQHRLLLRGKHGACRKLYPIETVSIEDDSKTGRAEQWVHSLWLVVTGFCRRAGMTILADASRHIVAGRRVCVMHSRRAGETMHPGKRCRPAADQRAKDGNDEDDHTHGANIGVSGAEEKVGGAVILSAGEGTSVLLRQGRQRSGAENAKTPCMRPAAVLVSIVDVPTQ